MADRHESAEAGAPEAISPAMLIAGERVLRSRWGELVDFYDEALFAMVCKEIYLAMAETRQKHPATRPKILKGVVTNIETIRAS